MSNGERKAVGWTENDIRHIAEEVSQVGPAPKREGNGMVTWKFLIPILVALSGVVGTAMLLSTAAADDAAEAKVAVKEKVSADMAVKSFYPRMDGVRLEEAVKRIKLDLEKHDKKLDRILEAVK